jgi:hypothetical protein
LLVSLQGAEFNVSRNEMEMSRSPPVPSPMISVVPSGDRILRSVLRVTLAKKSSTLGITLLVCRIWAVRTV